MLVRCLHQSFLSDGCASIPIEANRWTTLAGVPEEPQLAYMGCGGVQAFCRIRYFDGEKVSAFSCVGPCPTITSPFHRKGLVRASCINLVYCQPWPGNGYMHPVTWQPGCRTPR